MPIIKVNKQHVLNEWVAASMGFSGSQDFNNPGFSYDIKPLAFNLCQGGNDATMLNKNKAIKCFVGDIVKGFCPYDNKTHKGMVKYMFYIPGHEQDEPELIYIQDFSNEDTIPLEASTVRHCSSNIDPAGYAKDDYFRARNQEIAQDFAISTDAVIESQKFDFNKL